MILNSSQVAEKLKISRARVVAMVKRGELKALNSGTKHVHLKFDSKVVNEFRKANGYTRTINRKPIVNTPSTGIVTLLNEMNQKLDILIKMWS